MAAPEDDLWFGGGWPIWSGQFTPFGQEIVSGQVLSATLGNQQPGDGTAMHYKFTGKERDSESGLDYFGARYYASNVGRWISADWAQKPEAVPYSKLDDPQSLNLYEYVGNNPLSQPDADGHNWWDNLKSFGVGVAKGVQNLIAGPSQAMKGVGFDPACMACTGGKLPDASIPTATAANKYEAAGMITVTISAAVATGGDSSELETGETLSSTTTAISEPRFVAMPSGDVVPIPEGASGPTPVLNGSGKTTGFQYQGGSGGGGLDAKTTGVRVMDPTPARGTSPGYPNGYVSYNNSATPKPQTVNPQTGETVSRSDPSAHIPLNPQQ